MKKRGIQTQQVVMVCFMALLLLALHAGQGDSVCAQGPATCSRDRMTGSPLWERVLLWQVDNDLWACPWCGARDNAPWTATCLGCGYPVCNPGGFLFRPVETDMITGAYSSAHRAVDFGAPEGSPVSAAEDGVVVDARSDRWAGNVVRMVHEDGCQTLYGHLQEIGVAPGSFVRRGAVIARSGRTGTATGPHLHFEVLVRGVQVNPLPYLAP